MCVPRPPPHPRRSFPFHTRVLPPTNSGETGSLSIGLLRDDVSQYSNDGDDGAEPVLTLYPGEYTVTAGGASNADTLSATISIGA